MRNISQTAKNIIYKKYKIKDNAIDKACKFYDKDLNKSIYAGIFTYNLEEILIKLIYNSQDDIGKISTLRKQMCSSLSDKDIIELIFVEKSPIEREYILSLLNNELLKYIIQDFYSIPTIKKMCDEDAIKLHNLLLSPI